jgi:hypothetical protein
LCRRSTPLHPVSPLCTPRAQPPCSGPSANPVPVSFSITPGSSLSSILLFGAPVTDQTSTTYLEDVAANCSTPTFAAHPGQPVWIKVTSPGLLQPGHRAGRGGGVCRACALGTYRRFGTLLTTSYTKSWTCVACPPANVTTRK